jgi:hypothetical protein
MKKLIGKKDLKFILFLIFVHAIFFTMALLYKRIYNGDSFEYVYMALNIKEKGWFYSGNPALPVVKEYLTLRPPVYSIILAVVYTFIVNNWVVIVLQNLVSILNILVLRRTMRLLGYKRKYDYIFMALVMLYPAQFIHANTLAPDIILQTCTVLYFHQFVMLILVKHWKYALFMSLTLIAGFLIKPVLYPFSWVHCIILLAVATKYKLGLLRFSAVSVVPIIALMLYMSWNYGRTGKAHFSSTQSFNAIYYYYFYFANKNGLTEAKTFLKQERQKLDSIPVFKDRYDYANERGVLLLKSNFIPYMSYHLMHSARLLVNPGKGEMDLFVGRETLGGLYSAPKESLGAAIKKDGLAGINKYLRVNPTLALAMVVAVFNFIRLIGLGIFLFNRKTKIWIRIFVAGFICYFAITAGPIENTRYFIPVSLIAIGCAALGFQRVWQRYREMALMHKITNGGE